MISVRAPVRFVLSHYLWTRTLCLPGGQSTVEWIFANNVSNPIVQIVSKLYRYFQIISNFPDCFKTVQIIPDELKLSVYSPIMFTWSAVNSRVDFCKQRFKSSRSDSFKTVQIFPRDRMRSTDGTFYCIMCCLYSTISLYPTKLKFENHFPLEENKFWGIFLLSFRMTTFKTCHSYHSFGKQPKRPAQWHSPLHHALPCQNLCPCTKT